MNQPMITNIKAEREIPARKVNIMTQAKEGIELLMLPKLDLFPVNEMNPKHS